VPVHLDRSGNPWGPLYCSQPGGQERTLFRLADIQGLAGVDNGAHVGRVAGLASPDPGALQQETTGRSVVFYYPDTEIERMRRLQWARNQGMEINVGDCAALQYYTVQAGEQWNSVARRFNLTVGELQSANPHIFRRDGVLRPGDRLLAPNGIPIEVSERNTFHTVQAGDTWGSIAQQYSIPLRFLQTVNPDVVRPYFLLSPGDQIFIPTSEQLARVLH
jgi:LysM repeat protein